MTDDGCWEEEEEDETLQLGYLGSDAGALRSAPCLHDARSDAGWTMVIRKSWNRTKFTRRDEFLDKRGTVLGALWGDDDVILGQVADDRTTKGLLNISAVVDSGAEANALRGNMMQWIPLKPSTASESGRNLRGAGGDPIPSMGGRTATGRTDEGQSRRIVGGSGLSSEAPTPNC